MPVLTPNDLDSLVGTSYIDSEIRKSVTEALKSHVDPLQQTYDIFLSHAYLDIKRIRQINHFLEEELGLSVFVDSIEMPELDRSKVTPETARILRQVMNQSKTLAYAYSTKAVESRWMPWELGYSDAKHGRVAVFPLDPENEKKDIYVGVEYLGIYPYIDIHEQAGTGKRILWVNAPGRPFTQYSSLKHWVATGEVKVRV